jgi:aminomethyltransferase
VLHEFLMRALGETKTPDLNRLAFYSSLSIEAPQYGEMYVARLGYTGEDGFEISVPGEKTESLAKEFLEIGKIGNRVKLAGLGPRDSLRLEAGFCLYGNDLDDSTTPIEAGLKWLVQKKRVMEG